MISFYKILADGFFVLSVLAIFAAMVGWLVDDIWLASTQWLLLGIFSMLVAIYTKLSAKEDLEIMKKYKADKKK